MREAIERRIGGDCPYLLYRVPERTKKAKGRTHTYQLTGDTWARINNDASRDNIIRPRQLTALATHHQIEGREIRPPATLREITICAAQQNDESNRD